MMFSLADTSTDKRFNRIFLFLFICLFIFSPLYYQDNAGGEGLFLPFNNTVWIAASFLISLGLLKVIQTQRLMLPSMSMPLLVFPVIVTLMGALMSVALPVSWMFRLLSIWGGVLLFLSINQFRLNRRWLDNLALVLVLAGMVQSLIGLAHLLLPQNNNLGGLIPHSFGIPRGIFQQQNLNASFVATTLLIGVYCLSLPSFRRRPLVLRLFIFSALGLAALIIATSGSRIGILGTIVGLLLLIAARYRQLWQSRAVLISALATVAVAFTLSTQIKSQTGGISGSLQKFEEMTQTSNDPTRNDVRWMMYDSSLELILEKPLLGHGIGRFQPVWHDKKAEYLALHPEAAILIPRLSHPHNELLYWAVEGGVIAVIAILVVAIALLRQLWQLGWQRGGAYLSLLLPISLHTQVELPFYISQLHWILLITLLAIIASHRRKTVNFCLSQFGRAGALAITLALPVLATIFFVHALLANKATMDFQMSPVKDIAKLEFPSTNIYFSENTRFMQMQTVLRYGLNSGNRKALEAYIEWAQGHLIDTPDVAVFVGLALAYGGLEKFDAAYRVMDRALAIYPKGPLSETGKAALNDMARKAGRPAHYPDR